MEWSVGMVPRAPTPESLQTLDIRNARILSTPEWPFTAGLPIQRQLPYWNRSATVTLPETCDRFKHKLVQHRRIEQTRFRKREDADDEPGHGTQDEVKRSSWQQ